MLNVIMQSVMVPLLENSIFDFRRLCSSRQVLTAPSQPITYSLCLQPNVNAITLVRQLQQQQRQQQPQQQQQLQQPLQLAVQ